MEKRKLVALLCLVLLSFMVPRFSLQCVIEGKLTCVLIFVSLVEIPREGAGTALGDACETTEDCFASDSNSECDSSDYICVCAANYIEEFAVCKVKVDGLTACVSTDECPSNAACASQCSCNSGYTGASFLCTAVLGMGCSSTSQCTHLLVNTNCSSSQCACVSGYTGTTCSDDVIGMVCANDADCQIVLSNTVCSSLQCECAAGFSGFACSLSSPGNFMKTATVPFATILITVIYKCLI